jgi:glycosyltransferase involved in cell wall biosynthesis
MKPSLTFYTNIISPYQLDFFDELSNLFSLQVVFYAQNESGRSWEMSVTDLPYKVVVLEDGLTARSVQKLMPSYHYSMDIFKVASRDPSNSVILGGNYYIPNTLIALFLSAWKGKKIYWYGEKLFSAEGIKKKFKKILLQPIMIFTDAIFAVGESGIDSYMGYGYQKQCFNIPYNINNNKFYKELLDLNKLNSLHETYNSKDKIIILTSGALIKRKGIDTAIKSYLDLKESDKKKSELWILGDGPDEKELKSLASGCDTIKFLGFKQPSDIPYFFNLSDIFLFCSRYDGWGVVINEALASGMPIVVSDKVAAKEFVSNDNGFICNCEVISDYTSALEVLIGNDKLRLNMALKSRKVSEKWSSKLASEKVYKIISDT